MLKNKLVLIWECVRDAFHDKDVLRNMFTDLLKGLFLFFISYLTIIAILTLESKNVSIAVITFLIFIGMIYLYNNIIKFFYKGW